MDVVAAESRVHRRDVDAQIVVNGTAIQTLLNFYFYLPSPFPEQACYIPTERKCCESSAVDGEPVVTRFGVRRLWQNQQRS